VDSEPKAYITASSFRPNDLASPRLRALTDDLHPKTRRTGCAGTRGSFTLAREGKAPMMKGTVKWFNGQKGYGFIAPVERAGMYSLNEGQKISFEVVADRKTGKSSADNLRAD
jgi:CspA family cold shock protein